METIYLLTFKTPKSGNIVFLLKYNKNGDLFSAEIQDLKMSLNDEQRQWLWNFIPKTASECETPRDNVKVRKVESDLSFTAFWDLYNYKVGNRKRAKAHWDKLSATTKAMVMQKVKEYNFYMLHKSHDKVFAERFLSEKRYYNEFKISS